MHGDIDAVGARDLLARGFEIRGAARGEVQVASFRRRQLGDAEADAARAAGDERGASLQIQIHGDSSMRNDCRMLPQAKMPAPERRRNPRTAPASWISAA